MANPLAPLYSFEFFLMLACAAIYYKAAGMEDVSGFLWAGLSIGTFVLTWRVLGWGWLGDVMGQVALLGVIAVGRALLERRKT